MVGINAILTSDLNKQEISRVLQNLLTKTINCISSELNQKPILNQRMISIGTVQNSFSPSFNIYRTENEIIFSEKIFNMRKTTTIQNLIFHIIKESFMHFISIKVQNIIELFVDFTTILWIQKHFKIRNIENPIIVTINRNIYPETIAGKDSYHYYRLLELLFRKNIDFYSVFVKIAELYINNNLNESQLEKKFSSWVIQETIKDEDVIAPLLMKKNKEPIIDYFIQKGNKNSSSTELAKLLDKTDRAIQKAVRVISSKYTMFWLPVINYEKLRLHNYFLTIKMPVSTNIESIQKILLEIPYLKSLYVGYSDDYKILYSPSLISPHIVANSLDERLKYLENKNQLTEYTLQQYREKFMYSTLTFSKSNLFRKPTIETYKQLLSGDENRNFDLKKYVLLHDIRDISPIFSDEDFLSYNLLYFLSFLKAKYLLSGSYGGWIHELPKLLEKNDKSLDRMSEAVSFLSHLEHRATKRDFLSYCMYLRNTTNKNPDVLLFDTPLLDNQDSIIKDLCVFGLLYQFQLYDRTLFVLPGISHQHPVKELIKGKLSEANINANFYTANASTTRFVPWHNLFDFNEQKWLPKIKLN
jgi:hypothetical protein